LTEVTNWRKICHLKFIDIPRLEEAEQAAPNSDGEL